MQHTCFKCQSGFEIAPEDMNFYDSVSPVIGGKKYQIPPPTQCPDCRKQQRMIFRNERTFYRRSCDLCHRSIISVYHANTPFQVYCSDCWWNDKWDPLSYGQDYDFNASFFEQFKALYQRVPQLAMFNVHSENSEYSNYGARNKNCYLLIASDENENCYYGNYMWKCTRSLDCLYAHECELCYELVDAEKCYHSFYSQNIENCTDCWFSYDLKGCSNCFGCVGLRRKSYCFFNEQLEKQAYEKKRQEFILTSDLLPQLLQRRQDLKLQFPHKFASLLNCEACSGNYLLDSLNSQECYDAYGLEDSKFIINAPGKVKNCYDFVGCREIELSYQGVGVMGYNNLFCCFTFNDSNNVLYSSLIMQSNNVFGCVSLNRKSYCILNKQYSKEEYEELVPRIIEQMKLESKNITPASLPPTHYHLQPSFGDFFPTSLSPFGYNETVTREYFPLTKQQVEARGWNWYIDPEEQTQTAPVTGKDILKCQQCGHAYKIIPQEMKFYYEMKLPVPLKCADCRHHARMAQRNPQKLWERKCMKCYKAIKTTYAPDRPETVYCEECYLELV